MRFALLGLGTATPRHAIRQRDAAELALDFANAEPGGERTLRTLYRLTRIERRGSVLLEDPGPGSYRQSFFPPAGDTEAGPTTAARMERYAAAAGRLAVEAATRALRSAARTAAGPRAADITHLVTCSCTGFANPGFDLDLVRAFGLRADVSRTHVGFMGCQGAFNALRAAAAFAADPAAVVLVVSAELCSLHLQYGTRGDLVVANSIFADGAAAVVGVGPGHPAAAAARWRIARHWSRILPDTADAMGWKIGDHGFEMTLSARVPDLIGSHLAGIVQAALADAGLEAADVATWAIHPGGPRVLAQVAESLALPPAAIAGSREVLAAHGNMSSATILFILERVLGARQAAEVPSAAPAEPDAGPDPGPDSGPDSAGPVLALAFGPGLTVELALVERLAPQTDSSG